METLKNILSFGNTKLPKSTAIFNMSSAMRCPSDKLGLCKLSKVCYAKKAEHLYKQVLPFRDRQNYYFDKCTSDQFISEFNAAIAKKRIKVNLLRVSESGDFKNQNSIDKLNQISKGLNVKTYVYTARTDLNFKGVNFAVNFSGLENIDKLKTGEASNLFCGLNKVDYTEAISKKHIDGFKVVKCISDCKKCNICSKKGQKIIVIPIH